MENAEVTASTAPHTHKMADAEVAANDEEHGACQTQSIPLHTHTTLLSDAGEEDALSDGRLTDDLEAAMRDDFGHDQPGDMATHQQHQGSQQQPARTDRHPEAPHPGGIRVVSHATQCA